MQSVRSSAARTVLRRLASTTTTAAAAAAASSARLCPTLVTSASASSASLRTSTCPSSFVRTMSAAAAPQLSAAALAFKNPYAGARAPNAEELTLLAASIPLLKEHGVTLTTMFYKRMFVQHPELKNVFNQAHQATGMQPRALAGALFAYASNMTNLGALGGAVAHMAHRHVSLSILPNQYPIVGENLLIALSELLLSAGMEAKAVEAMCAAWGVAYGQLANILIEEEERLYRVAESVKGGWRGWREFTVQKKVEETDVNSTISSFYLVPKDGGALPSYLPGQFTTVRAHVPAKDGVEAYFQPRQYSLSAPSNEKYFRITVKREDSVPTVAVNPPVGCPMHRAGVVSTLLHTTLAVGSTVELAAPFGDFTLDTSATNPVVLLAAGVGITPLATMHDAAVQAKRPVSLLYACRSSAFHPLKEWFAANAAKNEPTRVYYSSPAATDKIGAQYDEAGLIDLAALATRADLAAKFLPSGADYYVCGPQAFMKSQLAALRQLGVPENKLHAELFGSGSVEA